jgi:SAM-dependent methyltransferase
VTPDDQTPAAPEGPQDHKAVFEMIYRKSKWGNGSGSGSSEAVTRPYRQFLQNFLRKHAIRSVLDVGCGDWQFSQHMNWTGIDYLGVDASETALISARRFERPGVRFQRVDAMGDDLPPADLLIAKDVLQHWSSDDILKFLPRLDRYRHVLITNGFPPKLLPKTNAPFRTGTSYRPIDLQLEPFNLPGEYVFSYESDEPKRVFHWSRPATPAPGLFGALARRLGFRTGAG